KKRLAGISPIADGRVPRGTCPRPLAAGAASRRPAGGEALAHRVKAFNLEPGRLEFGSGCHGLAGSHPPASVVVFGFHVERGPDLGRQERRRDGPAVSGRSPTG